MAPVVIHAPAIPDGFRRHGGIRALHLLGPALARRHVEASLDVGGVLPSPRAHATDVWPEVMAPRGDRAVWWHLAPTFLTDPTPLLRELAEQPTVTNRQWEAWFKAGVPTLQVPTADLDVRHPPARGARRHGTAIYMGKPSGVSLRREVVVAITRDWPEDKRTLADLLRSLELLVCADHLTALALEAVLCGCPVLFVGTDRDLGLARGRHAFTYANPDGYGWHYGTIPEGHLRVDVDQAFDHYRDHAVPSMERSIDRFADWCAA